MAFRKLWAAVNSFIQVNKDNIEVEHDPDGYIEVNGQRFAAWTTAIEAGVTESELPEGSFVVTTHATGRGTIFRVDDAGVLQATGGGSSGGGTTTVADATARLALTGLGIGSQVYQTDNGFFYTLQVVGGEAVAANWAIRNQMQFATTTVQTNVGTKQALLAAVPTGRKRIVTQIWLRDALGGDLSDNSGDLNFGFAADISAIGIYMVFVGEVVATGTNTMVIGPALTTGVGSVGSGVAGEIFGCLFEDASITATLDIDVWYYDIPA